MGHISSNDILPTANPAGQSDSVDRSAFTVREPILTRSGELWGYNLLVQSNSVTNESLTGAVRRAIHTTVNVVGVDNLIGRNSLFIRVTPQVLLAENYLVLPRKRTVLALDASSDLSEEALNACHTAEQMGYSLAIVGGTVRTLNGGVYELARYVCIDINQLTGDDGSVLLEKNQFANKKTLALNVETHEQFDIVKDLGCDFASGHFLCDSETVTGRAMEASRIMQMRLLAELHHDRIDFDKVEDTIKSDVALSYYLLRFLNSAALGIPNRITSIQQAMIMLGERHLRKWGCLVALSCLSCTHPHALLITGLVRARFCENLAEVQGYKERTLDAFLMGLFSIMDAVTGMPMEDALSSLPLHEDVRACLMGSRSGSLGQIFDLVYASERGAWGTVTAGCDAMGLSQRQVAMIYYDTLRWTQELFR